jgi:hypothetical protein
MLLRGIIMSEKTIALRLQTQQLDKVDNLKGMTGWNQSEIIRRLIDAAVVMPAAVRAELEMQGKQPSPLVANGAD